MSRVQRVTASLQRCVRLPGFIDAFLTLLAERAPQVRGCIASQEGGSLRIMAQRCVTTVLLAVAGAVPPDEARRKFDDCRATGGAGMTPEIYPAWAEAVVLAASTHDPEFSPELEADWRAVLAEGSHLALCGDAPASPTAPD